ncbi:MAG TPA: LptA/OstA family protein, partial [Chthoniobacterales bacterium]
MKFLWLTLLLLLVVAMPLCLLGQNVAAVSPTASTEPKANPKPAAAKTSASPGNKPKGLDFNAGVTGPITTEIYADEAFFDSNKSEGIFRGRVKVNDPRFNLQADKLTVFISKSALQSQNQTQGQASTPTPTPSPRQNQGPSQPPTQG